MAHIRNLFLWLLVVSLLMSPRSSKADTHYVSKSGSNTFPYTSWATAADTVARAVEAAGEWDTIQIGAGHFVTDTVTMKKGQVITGLGTDISILDSLPLTSSVVIHANDSCTIRDLTLIGTFGSVLASDVVQWDSTHPSIEVVIDNRGIYALDDKDLTIYRVTFKNMFHAISIFDNDKSDLGRTCRVDSCVFECFFEAILGFGATLEITHSTFSFDERAGSGAILSTVGLGPGSLLIESCEFWGLDTVGTNHSEAIKTIATDPIVIRNCLMYSNINGFALELNADGFANPMSSAIVENNSFVGWVVHLRTHRPGWVFRNNLLVRANVLALWPNSLPVSTYNITWDNTPWDSGIIADGDTIPNDLPGNSNNFNANPMFGDTLSYLLQAFSPAVDAGDPAILDLDGSRSDIGYTGGPAGISYAYVDLAPRPPQNLTAQPSANVVGLGWRHGHEADFAYYLVYRDTLPIGMAGSGTLLDTVYVDSTYSDSTVLKGSSYYYRVSAVDNSGLESELSAEVMVLVTAVGEDQETSLPRQFELMRAYPNPFNARAQIDLLIARPGLMTVEVFDVRGALVDTIHRGAVEPGIRVFNWQPRNLGSGVFFVRARMGGDNMVHKLLYLK